MPRFAVCERNSVRGRFVVPYRHRASQVAPLRGFPTVRPRRGDIHVARMTGRMTGRGGCGSPGRADATICRLRAEFRSRRIPLCRAGTGRHKWRPYGSSAVRHRRGDIHVARMTGGVPRGSSWRADAAGIGRITHIQKKPPVRGTFVPSHPEALDEAVCGGFHCAVPAPGVTSGAPTGLPQSATIGATFMSPG